MRGKLRDGTFTLGTFWLRRFRRLLPAVIVTLLGVIILTAIIEPEKLGDRALYSLSALFYVNNWQTIVGGQSYFDKFAGHGPLDHMWSLSIEEQFYLVWPLLLAGLFAVFRRRRRIIIATLVLAGLSFGWMWFLASQGADHTRIYEGTDTRAGGLLLGAVLGTAIAYQRHHGANTHFPSLVPGVLGLAGIIAISMMTNNDDIFLFHGGLVIASIGTVLVIVASLDTTAPFARVLGCAPMRWLGERSYGIYLWHLPVIGFLPREWMPGVAQNQWVAWGTAAFVSAVSTLLASVSWSLLENPIRKNGILKPFRQWRTEHFAGGMLRYPASIVSATGRIIGLALIFVAIPSLAGGKNTVNVAMELPDNASPTPPPTPTSTKAPAPSGGMRCSTVIHVGDSTSIRLFDVNQLPEGAESGFQTYIDDGAQSVVDSVFGARATTVGFDDYPSAVQSVTELLAQGQDPDTCWVIATGVNDAANFAALPDYGYTPNPDDIKADIRTMLDLLRDYKVMWNTVATYEPSNNYYKNENMQLFNEQLLDVADEYDNVAVWDWAKEVSDHPDWFIPGDGTHYVPEGNAERAKRFAQALANAFPASEREAGNVPFRKVVSS